jgi:hydroxymethylglutaryl-CoA reductase
MDTKNSKLSGFYKKNIQERLQIISDWASLTDNEKKVAAGQLGLSTEQANNMIENVIGIFSLPFAIATNFQINQKDYLIPLVVEEPSVVAALSNAAKMFREGGGFITKSDEPIMIGQIQLLDIDDLDATKEIILSNKSKLIEEANKVGGSIVKRGGGARDIEVRLFANTAIGNMIIVHLLYDTQEAMGANAINTAVEHIAPILEDLTNTRANLKILSNLTDRRKAYAEGIIPYQELERDGISGQEVVKRIVEAGVFAEIDPYRATTHNKGIMNGIDPIIIATGNDWRAVEAGAHAYAARNGSYSSMTKWWADKDGNLRGSIEIPMALGTVGGATRVNPSAQVAIKILGNPSSRELAEIVACVGLAQNLGAIRALATEGIQNGHMRMHAKQLAVSAGASNEQVAIVTQQMIAEKNIRLERAKEIVSELNKGTIS